MIRRGLSIKQALPQALKSFKGTSLRDVAPYGFNWLWRNILTSLYTRAGRRYAWWWGIDLGRNATFFGMPSFRKHPLSSISIGDGCAFSSASWKNPIGGRRRCSIIALRNAEIIIGPDSGFTSTVIFSGIRIEIGSRVFCGTDSTIMDFDGHSLHADERIEGGGGYGAMEPIVIGDDVWLGQNVLVLKGCRIGKGTVVAANSIVTRDIPENVVAGGTPARVLKDISVQTARDFTL